MVVCKFFMQGYCRFGDQCRYEHIDHYRSNYDYKESDYNRPSGISVLKASIPSSGLQQQSASQHFQQPQQNNPSVSQVFNIHDLMQVVSKDLLQAEKCNQWQLSCYSPYKELMNIPDLVDYSPEELRCEYYIAIQNGRMPVCQAIVQQLHANVTKVTNKLKKKDTAYVIIERWLREREAVNSQKTASLMESNNKFQSFSMASSAHMPTTNIRQPTEVNFSFSLPQETLNPQLQQQPVTTPIQQQMVVGFQQQSATGGDQMKVESHVDFVDNTEYSMVDELNESELEAFRGRFVFGSIPTKPPPRELC